MLDNLNELIEINLTILLKAKNNFTHKFDLVNIENLVFSQIGKPNDSERLYNMMNQKGLLDLNQNDSKYFVLSEFGFDIIKKGGWLKHLEREEKRAIRKEQKDQFYFQISRFQAKSKYYPHIIATLSLIISIIAYNRPIDKHINSLLPKGEIPHIIDSASFKPQDVNTFHSSKGR